MTDLITVTGLTDPVTDRVSGSCLHFKSPATVKSPTSFEAQEGLGKEEP